MHPLSGNSDRPGEEVDPGVAEEVEAAVVGLVEVVVAYLLLAVDLVSVAWKIAAWVVLLLQEEDGE